MVSMILGDPKTQWSNQINQFLTDNAYAGPTPVSYTRDMYGRDMSSDFMGNSRAAGGAPTTININTIDSQGVADFFDKNTIALDGGMLKVFQNGNRSVPQLRQVMLGGS
jgi:hypothetical protein